MTVRSLRVATPIVLLILTIALALPGKAAWASNAAGQDVSAVERAASAGNVYAVLAAIFSEIANSPENADVILQDALARAPQYRDDIVRVASPLFPSIKKPVQVAATSEIPASGTEASAAATSEMPDEWSGESSLGAGMATGNSKTQQLNAAFKVLYEPAPWSNEFNLNFDFARDNSETSAQRLVTNFESRRDLDERLFAFGFAQYEDDRFSGFDYELTESAGLGYRVIETESLTLTVQAGPGLRQSKVTSTEETENELIARGNSGLEWRISESAKLTNDLTVTTGSERTVTEDTVALTTAVMGNISARFSFNVRNNSEPPATAKSTDTTTKALLVYGF